MIFSQLNLVILPILGKVCPEFDEGSGHLFERSSCFSFVFESV